MHRKDIYGDYILGYLQISTILQSFMITFFRYVHICECENFERQCLKCRTAQTSLGDSKINTILRRLCITFSVG
jgi:hypothetical protein